MTQAFTQDKPNLINEPIDISCFSITETLSLPSNPSISQISTTSFPPNFPTNLDDKNSAIETTNIIATLFSKARATALTGYKFTTTFSETKVQSS